MSDVWAVHRCGLTRDLGLSLVGSHRWHLEQGANSRCSVDTEDRFGVVFGGVASLKDQIQSGLIQMKKIRINVSCVSAWGICLWLSAVEEPLSSFGVLNSLLFLNIHEMYLFINSQSLLGTTELRDSPDVSRSSVTWFCQSMINRLWRAEIMLSFGNLPSFLKVEGHQHLLRAHILCARTCLVLLD